jgi:hypothetical protein
MIMPLGDLLTISEAARLLCVSRQHMHKLIEDYHLNVDEVHARLFVLHPSELKKIPAKRQPGRKSSKKTK